MLSHTEHHLSEVNHNYEGNLVELTQAQWQSAAILSRFKAT